MVTIDPSNPLTRARQAIADIVNTAHPDIECYAFVPDTGVYPVGFTELRPATYITTRKNRRRRDLSLVVLVGREGLAQDAQQDVDALLEGVNDIATILSKDRSLLGTVVDSNVKGDDGLSLQQLAGYNAWGHQWEITIELAQEL